MRRDERGSKERERVDRRNVYAREMPIYRLFLAASV